MSNYDMRSMQYRTRANLLDWPGSIRTPVFAIRDAQWSVLFFGRFDVVHSLLSGLNLGTGSSVAWNPLRFDEISSQVDEGGVFLAQEIDHLDVCLWSANRIL